MARHLHSDDASFELHFFYRTPQLAPFYHELKSSPFASNITFHEGLDAAAVQQVLRDILRRPDTGTHVYFCGPPPFMETAHELARASWPQASIHFELFAAQTFSSDATGSFTIQLAKAGGEYVVHAGETILDVLRNNGIEVEVSCEVGICGTCITRVLAGAPDHRDQVLTKAEHESGSVMTVCCSRASTPTLVLDI
jgi:vanillate O-demethylase ferredoxin subunit